MAKVSKLCYKFLMGYLYGLFCKIHSNLLFGVISFFKCLLFVLAYTSIPYTGCANKKQSPRKNAVFQP